MGNILGNNLIKKRIIILRGVPGSGKTAVAEEIAEKYPKRKVKIISTDDFWYLNEQKEYRFNPKNLYKAHTWNQERFAKLIKQKKLWCIIVNNTNTEKWEMRPYVKTALEGGYNNIEFVQPVTYRWINKDVETCFKTQKYNVPKHVIQAMVDRFDNHVNLHNLFD